jgi:hypothetical protein
MTKYTVTGPFPIADVAPGGTVDLDPDTVNVDALIEAGHIEATTKPVHSKGKSGE